MAYHLKVLFLTHAICQQLVSYSFASDAFSLWGQCWFQSLSRICWFHVRDSCEPGNYFMASAQTCTQNYAHSQSIGWSKTCDQLIINVTRRYISSREATQADANVQRQIIPLYIQRKRRINTWRKKCKCNLLQFLFFFFFVSLSFSPLEKEMATQSSILAWKIQRMEEPGRLQSMGSLRVRHNWATSLSLFTFMHSRRTWQPTPVFLPGESQGQRSLVGCRLWGHTESDMTEVA